MKNICLIWIGLVCCLCSAPSLARTLTYPVLFIHGIWSNATTWETAIEELAARGYKYGGVVQATEIPVPGQDSMPSAARCITSAEPNRKNTTVYLPSCVGDADFYVWETTDYCDRPVTGGILCGNDNLTS
jgi:hypothetical protein